jgi:hypothetical protein
MNEGQKFLVPVAGRLVFDPHTRQRLKDEGEWKNFDPLWARKIMFGDVVEAEDPAAKPTEAPADAPDAVGGRQSRKRVRE